MSSSAQLSLLPWLLRWEPAPDRTAFAAGLHAGSAFGMALALRPSLDARTAGRLVLASIPAGVAGLLGQDVVERRLGGPGPTAAALAGFGVLLWAADRRPQDRPLDGRAWTAASLAQVVALVPGVSRSGATVTALRLVRVPRAQSLEASLLLSLPVTAGAATVTSVRYGTRPPAVPTLLAGGSALLAWRALPKGSPRLLPASAVYRLALAAVVARRLRRESR